MILVDSSVWIDYFRGMQTREVDRLEALLDSEIVVTGDLILAEVLQGFRDERDFANARRLLTGLTILELAGREVALEAAENFRRLRAKGVTIRKSIDTIIATRCIRDGYRLLYSDRDFDSFVEHLQLQSALRE